MAILMLLPLLSFYTPPVNAEVFPITVTPTQGPPGTTVILAANDLTVFDPLYHAYAMFDTTPADYDENQDLTTFQTTALFAVGDEVFRDLDGSLDYTAGEPMYRVGTINNLGFVSALDVRLSVSIVGSVVYAAGTTVNAADADVGLAYMAFAAGEMYVDWDGSLDYTPNEEIVLDVDGTGLIVDAPGVTPGDQRLNYPNTQHYDLLDSWTYHLNSLVTANVFDFQEGLYFDTDGNGEVSAGDVRARQYVAPEVSYNFPLPTDAGDIDALAALPLLPFATTAGMAITDEVYVDLDLNGAYSYGEPIYTMVAAPTGFVQLTDLRNSYVADPLAGTFYLPNTAVAPGDSDIGAPYSQFDTLTTGFEMYFDLDGNLAYSCDAIAFSGHCDWVYFDTDGGLLVNAGDVRLSDITISDAFLMANAALWTWPLAGTKGDTTQAQPFAPGVLVTAHDADVGIELVAIPSAPLPAVNPPMMYLDTGVVGYSPDDPIYIDNDGDGWVSAGDERLTVVSVQDATYTPVASPGWATPPQAVPAWYWPGSIVAAGNTDVGQLLTFFLGIIDPDSFAENIYRDQAYSTEIMPPVYGTDAAGFMGPFPIPLGGYVGGHQTMTFTIPDDYTLLGGVHVILLGTDLNPNLGYVAPWNNMGFLQLAGLTVYPMAAAWKNPMNPLPWGDGTVHAADSYTWAEMAVGLVNNLAGPAFFYLNTPSTGDGTIQSIFLHPGVADPYKPGWSHTLDTLWGTQANYQFGDEFPGQPLTNRQTREVFDHYLDYAIMASASDSIGDFQFDVTVGPAPINAIQIYVPNDFQWLAPSVEESIWTDITNDYQYIWTQVLRDYDPIAPGWTRVTIGMDEWWGGLTTINPGVYHIRFFNLRAPTVAGLYHFKIFFVAGMSYVPVSIGPGNFPVVIVKSELNPAWIAVTVRTHLMLAPPLVSGRVLAEGTTPEGRSVSGVAYWGPNEFFMNSVVANAPGAIYRTWLFGLAAGTYTLTAEASGYSPTITERLTLDPGQSYSHYIVLLDSPNISVTVWSKHGTGAIPWGNLWQMPYGTNNPALAPVNAPPWPRRDILIELYDSQNNRIGWWATNNVGAPKYIHPWWTLAGNNELIGLHDDFIGGDSGPTPTEVQYWAQLTDNWDLLGNLRGPIWGNTATHWDGHVPWDQADYVAGLTNAQYTVEAFVTGYIMDDADAYQRSFTLSGTSLALQFDLRRSNWAEVVMHLPEMTFLSSTTTVALTAEDADGNERASIAFRAPPWMSADGRIDGLDASNLRALELGIAC
jgi:hypothetical protein